jgi:hypothetical protein
MFAALAVAAWGPARAAAGPAERMEEARAMAKADRPAARSLVQGVLIAPDAAPELRWEAALWLASDRERERGDPGGALELTTPLWVRVLAGDVPGADPRAQRRLETRTAEVHSRVLADLGRLDEARRVEEALIARDGARAGRPAAEEEPGPTPRRRDRATQAAERQRRIQLRGAAWASLVVFGLVAGPPAVRNARRRRRPRPLGAALAAGFALGAGAIGEFWDPGAGAAAGWMAAGFAGVHVVAVFALVDPRPPALRPVLRALAAAATLGAAYLALERGGTLSWVGL